MLHRFTLPILLLWTCGSLFADDPASTTFRVEVGGAALPVTRYEDLDCVHFPFTGPVEVAITRLDGQPIGEQGASTQALFRT